jgi:hypothetical protein
MLGINAMNPKTNVATVPIFYIKEARPKNMEILKQAKSMRGMKIVAHAFKGFL